MLKLQTNKRAILIVTILPLVISALFAFTTAQAENEDSPNLGEGFSAYPLNPNVINQNRFIFELKPGESTTDTLVIQNSTDEKINFEIYGADQIKQEGESEENSSSLYKTKSETQDEVGQWIKTGSNQVEIDAQQIAPIKFTVEVPAETPYGHYQGIIAIEKSANNDNKTGINVTSRIGTIVEIIVTDTPHPPMKLLPEPTLLDRINKTHFAIALALFFISGSYLVYSRRKSRN